LQKIRQRTEEILNEAQAGFRARRSTIDQLFTLRRLAETFIRNSAYAFYVDFQKAFDSVWTIGLWRVRRFLVYEDKILRILEALYEDTMSAVRVDTELSEWFLTVIIVKKLNSLKHLVRTTVAKSHN